jgi:DNA helicase HerA-like ATPase
VKLLDAEEGGSILSKLSWKLRSSIPIKLESISIIEGRYLAISKGGSQRLFSLLRVRLAEDEQANDSKLDYSSTVRITLQQQRMKGLFDGLHRSKVPFLYLTLVRPSNNEDETEGEHVFEFDLVIGTWADVKVKELQSAVSVLEQNANILAATLSVGIPNSTVRRLTRNELKDFVKSFLLPLEPRLPQIGSSSTISTIESFDERSPMVSNKVVVPNFYVPNAAESGKGGILVGRVRSGAGNMHEFKLQLEDLKKHITIIGMTGAGKSTTAAVMARQIAGLGLPAMILDWHNEHGNMIKSSGGRIVAPSKDDFALNPLDFSGSIDPIEHIALVTDIFSDIYRFTHPQAYMFRNALQRCLGEASEHEIPTLSSLVRTIESYPLRSAYDNETKVALLRRLVPLTQGQAGKALNRPATHTIDELLDKVFCVELGHIRDLQTRSIFAEILLKIVYEYRVTRQSRMEHIMVVEEARNLAPARREEDPPSVGERMISELRKFGESMIFIAQFPTQISSEIIKNSGTRIIHRVAWMEDLKLIGEALNLDREQLAYIANLGVGEAVINLIRLQKPILVQITSDFLSVESKDLSSSAEL